MYVHGAIKLHYYQTFQPILITMFKYLHFFQHISTNARIAEALSKMKNFVCLNVHAYSGVFWIRQGPHRSIPLQCIRSSQASGKKQEPVSLAKEGARSCRPRLEVGATDYTQKNKKSPCTHCFAIGIAVLSRLPATAAAAVAAA